MVRLHHCALVHREQHVRMPAAEEVFLVLNATPLPIWAIWIAAPRSGVARRLAHSQWPWVCLAAVFAVCFAIGLVATEPGLRPSGASFTSLKGVMALFDAKWGVMAAWAHYLCFDTFVGRWMMNDAPDAGYRLSPILLATALLGPVGLLLFLLLRVYLGPAANGQTASGG
jgi:Domain of unknown function (DUF4281)